MNNRQSCCKYREEIERLAAERKRRAKIDRLNKIENCQQIKSSCVKCPKKKITKNSKNEGKKCNLLGKIKPPLKVREMYANPQHVVCFSEKMKGEIKKTMQTRITNGDNSWCKTSEDKLSMDLNCESVCSFDSVVNLEGLTLTSEELKKIEKNRVNVQPPEENKEAGIEEMKDDEDNVENETENEEFKESNENEIEKTPSELTSSFTTANEFMTENETENN